VPGGRKRPGGGETAENECSATRAFVGPLCLSSVASVSTRRVSSTSGNSTPKPPPSRRNVATSGSSLMSQGTGGVKGKPASLVASVDP
jgi:hypothetical protein